MTRRRTVIDLLEHASTSDDTGLRLLDRNENPSWYTWAELHSRASRVAGGLHEVGVERGERVALVYATSVAFFDAFFGTLLAGAVPVPLYPPVRFGRLGEYAERTAAMLQAVDASVVLTSSGVRRLLGPALEKYWPRLGCKTLEELPSAESIVVCVDDSELALIQFSSGTTAHPKPVALSHRAVVAQATCLNGCWPEVPGQPEIGVSWLPLYHDMGLIGCILPSIERPTSLTLIPPEVFVSRPAIWLRAISRYRATISPAPNFAYGLCVDRIRDEELEGVDLSSWRIALNGAEPVAPRVLRKFQERFSHWGLRAEALTPVYGLSEAALAVTFSALDRPFTSRCFDRDLLSEDGEAVESRDGIEIVSVGRALPDFELRLLGPDQRQVRPGRIGRILVRGPSLMEGYLGCPEETSRVLQDGWLDTGDLGFIHEGELFLSGRAKDVLILRGRNHSPVEVEHAVDGVEGLRTGCSVAMSFLPEGADGEQLVLLVEARKGIHKSEYERLAGEASCAVRAATALDPDHLEVLEPGTLPRTSSGKLRRREALRLWNLGTLAPPSPVTTLRMAGLLAKSSLALGRARRQNGRK